MEEEELPDDKTLEYDDETLELTLPSGHMTLNMFSVKVVPAIPGPNVNDHIPLIFPRHPLAARLKKPRPCRRPRLRDRSNQSQSAQTSCLSL